MVAYSKFLTGNPESNSIIASMDMQAAKTNEFELEAGPLHRAPGRTRRSAGTKSGQSLASAFKCSGREARKGRHSARFRRRDRHKGHQDSR